MWKNSIKSPPAAEYRTGPETRVLNLKMHWNLIYYFFKIILYIIIIFIIIKFKFFCLRDF